MSLSVKFQQLTRRLLLQCCTIYTGTSFVMGYHFTALNLPSDYIKEFYNNTYTSRGSPLTPNMSTLLFSLTSTIYLVGGFCGSLLAGGISKRCGRKRTVLLCQIPQVIGVVLQSICVLTASPELLIVGRFIIGWSVGMSCQIVPGYVSELSPCHIRGALTGGHQVITNVGIFVCGVVGLKGILGTEELWIYILVLPIVPALISTLILLFLPESPRYLLIDRNRVSEAAKSLRFLRQKKDVDDELEEMKREAASMEEQNTKKYTFLRVIQLKQYRLPMFLVFLLPVALNGSGLVGVFVYSVGIFRKIGLTEDKVEFAVLGTYTTIVFGAIISAYFVDHFGRRPLQIFSLLTIIASLATLTICIQFQASENWLAYISLVCLIVFSLMLSIGPGGVLWIAVPELFKQGPRDTALAFAAAVNWVIKIIIAASFEFLSGAMDHFVFLLFLGIEVIVLVLFYWKMPETKNKTFQEISEMLNGPKQEARVETTKL